MTTWQKLNDVYLEHGIQGILNLDSKRSYILRWAARYGHLDVVEVLLQYQRVDPWNALIEAVAEGHLAVVVRLLQDSRVDPSYLGNIAIGVASDYGQLAIVQRLLQDPRVDPSGQAYAIEGASEGGHLNVTKRLLRDPRVKVTRNALFHAEFQKNEAMLYVLQSYREELNARRLTTMMCLQRRGIYFDIRRLIFELIV